MARRTKEEALETRSKLLDAAECLFQSQGVSGTTLQDIAVRAGTTRGAVYWHFKDKAALFNAMMERITLPLEAYFNQPEAQPSPGSEPAAPALERTRHAIISALSQIVNDAQTRRVLEVATQKVEYVEENSTIRLRHLRARNFFLCRVEEGLTCAVSQARLTPEVTAAMAARGLHSLIDGLIQNWLLDPQAFDLVEAGRCAMDIYFRGLGFGSAQPGHAPG
ncbi:MAG: TetR family transcriptional regulator [Polaromonas sp.]